MKPHRCARTLFASRNEAALIKNAAVHKKAGKKKAPPQERQSPARANDNASVSRRRGHCDRGGRRNNCAKSTREEPNDAVDQLGKRLMRQMLPPPPSHLSAPKSKSGAEIARTVTDASRVRLMREGAARLGRLSDWFSTRPLPRAARAAPRDASGGGESCRERRVRLRGGCGRELLRRADGGRPAAPPRRARARQ